MKTLIGFTLEIDDKALGQKTRLRNVKSITAILKTLKPILWQFLLSDNQELPIKLTKTPYTK